MLNDRTAARPAAARPVAAFDAAGLRRRLGGLIAVFSSLRPAPAGPALSPHLARDSGLINEAPDTSTAARAARDRARAFEQDLLRGI